MYAMVPKQVVILLHNTTAITLVIQLVTIITKAIAILHLITEDAADVENNISDTTKAYSTECVL
ncbi:hypothetical protein VEHSUH05_08200 [Veillonella denticariosi JCM 15641]|uniref:Uncharacterized protein n=1 Tax=Veillonella denticariosi JCM 15641 TaxID=1298594 RepID=A0A2S7Z7T3_9FIRM|nr:hypothetical protein VEHSUH05_08200 [Veillonella denticariosi JCM 15641]